MVRASPPRRVAASRWEEASIDRDSSQPTVTRAQELFTSWVMDMLVFIVVLELFVQYLPKVVTESFTVSIFTAVILKLLIEGITWLEHRAQGWVTRREGSGWRALGLVVTFLILFSSKFVVL